MTHSKTSGLPRAVPGNTAFSGPGPGSSRVVAQLEPHTWLLIHASLTLPLHACMHLLPLV